MGTPMKGQVTLEPSFAQTLIPGDHQICWGIFIQQDPSGGWNFDPETTLSASNRGRCAVYQAGQLAYPVAERVIPRVPSSNAGDARDPDPSDDFADRQEFYAAWVKDGFGNIVTIGDLLQYEVRDTFVDAIALEGLDASGTVWSSRDVMHLPAPWQPHSFQDGSAARLTVRLPEPAQEAMTVEVILSGILQDQNTPPNRHLFVGVPVGDQEVTYGIHVSGDGSMPDDPNMVGCFSWLGTMRIDAYPTSRGFGYAQRVRYLEVPVTHRPNAGGVLSLSGEPCTGVDIVDKGVNHVHWRAWDPLLDLSVFPSSVFIDVLVPDGGVIGGAVPPVLQ